MVQRVEATEAALALIAKLQSIHGPLMFVQSAGCCDGTAPMCYARGDFKVGSSDVLIGNIGGQPYYIGVSQFDYLKNMHVTIDAEPGRGSGFSLETTESMCFTIRSRIFSDDEATLLTSTPLFDGEGRPFKTATFSQ